MKSAEAKAIKNVPKLILYAHEDEIIPLADFYREVIGLEQKSTTNSRWVEFSAGNIEICLHHMRVAVGRDPKTSELPDEKEFKSTHILFELETKEDVIAEYDRLIKLGGLEKVDFIQGTKSAILDGVKTINNYNYIYLTDRVGNVIQIESPKK